MINYTKIKISYYKGSEQFDKENTNRKLTFDFVIESFKRVHFDHKNGNVASYLRPRENMPGGGYGPSMANYSTDAILRLMINDPSDNPLEKEKALIVMVQKGIDIYYIVKQGRIYTGAGHDPGHPLPLAFAATLLDEWPRVYSHLQKQT